MRKAWNLRWYEMSAEERRYEFSTAPGVVGHAHSEQSRPGYGLDTADSQRADGRVGNRLRGPIPDPKPGTGPDPGPGRFGKSGAGL